MVEVFSLKLLYAIPQAASFEDQVLLDLARTKLVSYHIVKYDRLSVSITPPKIYHLRVSNIFIAEKGLHDNDNMYDKVAGIKYLTYGDSAGDNWISYDDPTYITFTLWQKRLANENKDFPS